MFRALAGVSRIAHPGNLSCFDKAIGPISDRLALLIFAEFGKWAKECFKLLCFVCHCKLLTFFFTRAATRACSLLLAFLPPPALHATSLSPPHRVRRHQQKSTIWPHRSGQTSGHQSRRSLPHQRTQTANQGYS